MLKQLNCWMQISPQLSRFLNWSNDHHDPDISLTVCDISGWPYWGQEAISEDTMLKRGGGVCRSLWPWCEGGGWISCSYREEEGSPGYVRWRGKVQLKCGDGRTFVLLTDKGAPKVAWQIDLGVLVIFLLLLESIAAKSWWNRSARGDTTVHCTDFYWFLLSM